MTPREELAILAPQARTLPPGETELEVIAALIRPIAEREGTLRWCTVDRWRNHPAIQESIGAGEPLVILWPDETWTLVDNMREAIYSAIPMPSAQSSARLLMAKRKVRQTEGGAPA